MVNLIRELYILQNLNVHFADRNVSYKNYANTRSWRNVSCRL